MAPSSDVFSIFWLFSDFQVKEKWTYVVRITIPSYIAGRTKLWLTATYNSVVYGYSCTLPQLTAMIAVCLEVPSPNIATHMQTMTNSYI